MIRKLFIIFLLLLLLLTPTIVFGQTEGVYISNEETLEDTVVFFVSPENKIGIRKIDPEVELDVNGKIRAGNYEKTTGNINAYSLELGGSSPSSTNQQATLLFHHWDANAHQLRYSAGKLYWEAAANTSPTSSDPDFIVGGRVFTTGGIAINSNNTPPALLSIQNSGGDDAKLLNFSEDNGLEFYFESGFAGTGASGNKLKLKVPESWSEFPLMSWRGDGHVGIRTHNPDANLHIRGNIDNNGSSTAIVKLTNNDETQVLLMDTNEIDQIGDKLLLNHNSNTNVGMVNGGGKVGIGDNSPEAKLHVYNGGVAIGKNTSINNDFASKRCIQLSTTDYFSSDDSDNHTGALIFTSLPDGWGSGQLRVRMSSGWATYYNEDAIAIGHDRTHIRDFLTFGYFENNGTIYEDDDTGIRHEADGKLHFMSNNAARIKISHGGDSTVEILGHTDNNGTSASLRITNGGQRMLIDSNEIDTNDDNLYLLYNSGGADVKIHDSCIVGNNLYANLPYGDHGNAQFRTSDDKFYYDNSSRKFKRNIRNLQDDFYKILQAQPKTYTRPNADFPDRWEIGYIAEELDELGLNNLVYYREKCLSEDGKVIDTWDDGFKVGDPEGVNYRKISLYLVEIVKDQQQKLEELESRIQQLERN